MAGILVAFIVFIINDIPGTLLGDIFGLYSSCDGFGVASYVGFIVALFVGIIVGCNVGYFERVTDGLFIGDIVGVYKYERDIDGFSVGYSVSNGIYVGDVVGTTVGLIDGFIVKFSIFDAFQILVFDLKQQFCFDILLVD